MYIIWRDKENKLKKIHCTSYELARKIYPYIKDFKVKEISNNEFGCACGLYDTSKMKQMIICA